MRGDRLNALKNGGHFQAWLHSPKSRMLILAGYNNVSAYSSGECWVSHVALDMIEGIKSSVQSRPYAFYLLGHRQAEADLFPGIFASIIHQLLLSNRQALRNDSQYSELLARLEEYRAAVEIEQQAPSAHEYNDRPAACLQTLAVKALNMFDGTKPIWIILDLVDRCKSGKTNHRKKLMKALVHLLEETTVTVRVLVVVNGYDWRLDEQSDELGQRSQDSVIIHRAQQRRIA